MPKANAIGTVFTKLLTLGLVRDVEKRFERSQAESLVNDFLNNNVPGVTVPKHLIDELEKSKDQLEKGIEIAARQIKELKTFCDGAHIMAIGQEESVVNIIEAAA